MDKLLNYKGYHGSVDFDLDGNYLYGKVLHINDLVTYEAENLEQLKVEFQLAVDDYIETCEQIGKSPDKSFSGTFNVRTTPEIHKKLTTIALATGENLNSIANKAFASFIDSSSDKSKSHTVIVQIQHQEAMNSASSQSGITWKSDNSFVTAAHEQFTYIQ